MTVARVESLSVPKWRDGRRGGDDVVVALPDRLFAVFDGATDTSGTFKAPMSPGRFAATTAAQAMLGLVGRPEGPGPDHGAWIRAMNQAIAEELARLGVPAARVSSTAALALIGDVQIDLLVVGDSGIRINGQRLLHLTKAIDRLFTQVRLAVRDQLMQLGLHGMALETATRQLVFKGLDQTHGFDIPAARVDAIIGTVEQACAGRFEADALARIPDMVRSGIAGGQYPFANRAGHSLGYASINGGETCGPDLRHVVLPVAEVHSLELFSDGYMECPPAGISVADWEAHFAQCETEDPTKTGRFAGVKGSTDDYWSDDRSVVSVTFETS